MTNPSFSPPSRLLMGPGPINADPRVLRALSAQMVGQFDPVMTDLMKHVMELYREVFQTRNAHTLLIDGTARAGIEAALVSLLEPGDRVLVPIFGRFGYLLREICERVGAHVCTLEVNWGEVFSLEVLAQAIRENRPKVLALVHGDTSTTMLQPLHGLAEICQKYGTLLYVDVTASLGGNRFDMDELGIDVATAGLQKCLAGPPGSSPASFSPAAVADITARSSIEAGLRDVATGHLERRISSNYFDMSMIFDYWNEERLNHHTEATSMLYAAAECARLLVNESMSAAVDRHQLHGAAMRAGVEGLGLTIFGDQRYRMNNVVAVEIPQGVNGDAVRQDLLHDFAIEIGSSFGPLHGRVWRIGTMGYNARRDAVLTTLVALESVLQRHGVAIPHGGGVDAALSAYQTHDAGLEAVLDTEQITAVGVDASIGSNQTPNTGVLDSFGTEQVPAAELEAVLDTDHTPRADLKATI